jgi:hypothetical protein
VDGRPPKRLSREALELLHRYPWPGNIRELKNVIERAKIIAEGEVIGADAIILDSSFELGAGFAMQPERTVASAIEARASAGAYSGRAEERPPAPPPGRPVFGGGDDGEDGADAEDAEDEEEDGGGGRPGDEETTAVAIGAGRGPKAAGAIGPLSPEEVLSPARRTMPPAPASGFALDPSLEPLYFQLNERQRKLVEYLCRYGSIKNRDYYKIMNVSKSTGWRDLKDLVDRGIVLVHGKGKGSAYSLSKGGAPGPAGASRPR